MGDIPAADEVAGGSETWDDPDANGRGDEDGPGAMVRCYGACEVPLLTRLADERVKLRPCLCGLERDDGRTRVR